MQNNFLTIKKKKKIQKVLLLWNSRTLNLERRIMIFKTLAISKICFANQLAGFYVRATLVFNGLNEKLFSFGISKTSQFCNQNKETIEHLFCHCFVAKALWNGLSTFENYLSLYH